MLNLKFAIEYSKVLEWIKPMLDSQIPFCLNTECTTTLGMIKERDLEWIKFIFERINDVKQ